MLNDTTKISIGVDICEKFLDVCIYQTGKFYQFSNDEKGFSEFLKVIKDFSNCHVVLEATGGLERGIAVFLHKSNVSFSVVNPAQIWAYRRTIGQNAKTDSIDAFIIAEYGVKFDLKKSETYSEIELELKELSSRRNQLSKAIVAEKLRLRRAKSSIVINSIEMNLASLKKDLKVIEQAISELIKTNENKTANKEILKSIPGIAEVVSNTMISELPELGNANSKEITALTGLAPFVVQSGKYTGKARIKGGRKEVRDKLYMAAIVAKTHNPVIKEFFERLIARGKSFKQAITACMRKLLIIANTLVAKGEKWDIEKAVFNKNTA